ncbi:transglutaminase family protein [Cellulosimicrobium sp. Marseille-Q8652]
MNDHATSRPRSTAPAGLGARVLATTLCVAVAVAASTYALGTVIGPGDWTRTAVRTLAVLALVTGLSRYALERSRSVQGEALAPPAALLPSLAGLVVGSWALLGLYGGPTDRFSVLIGLSNVERLLSRVQTGRELTLAEVAPIDPSLPIELLAVGGAVVVFLVADLMAGGLRLGAGVGLPLLALWIPGLVIVGDVPPVAFVLTVTALVLLLAVDNPHRALRRAGAGEGRGRQRAVGGSRVVTAVATALAVATVGLGVGAASATLPEVASSSWNRLFSSTGDTVRLSDDLDMRRDLAERSDEVVLEYRTDGDEVGPLRVFTLTGFDGTNWRRGADRDGTPIEGPDQLLWPQDTGRGEPSEVTVTLRSLRDTKLPVPTEPRSVDVDGDWTYDPVRDEVLGTRATSAGSSYEMTLYARALDADTLRSAGGADPDDPNYLDVPASSHEQDIRDLAAQVVQGSPTRYDQALALQTYFRDAATFTYSTQVPPGDSGDAVWDFLQQRTGYCVQFATAMTMMARTLGIPARLGVGFLPGQRTDDTTFQVTGRDSHAWPELYFPGQGWVRFEPTPAQQTGPAPTWATPVGSSTVPGLTDPSDALTPGVVPGPEEPATPAPTVGGGTGGADAAADGSGASWLVVVAAFLLVALTAGALWLVARRRTRPEGDLDAERAWVELTARLDGLGVTWHASTTPRNVPTTVAAVVRDRSGSDLSDAGVEALVALVTALETERYARDGAATEPARLAELVETSAAEVERSLSDRRARDDGPSALRVG